MEFRFEFRITIVGGGRPKRPSYSIKNTDAESWKEHEGVCCAAYSINYFLYYKTRQYYRHKPKALRDAKNLQDELEWGDEIEINQVEQFIKIYPKFKITVLAESLIKNTPLCTFSGAEYNPESYKTNSIYLIHDGQTHLALICTPNTAADRNYNWCYTCDIAYRREYAHSCDGESDPKRHKPIATKCNKCDIFGCAGGKDCPYYRCRTCNVTYERDAPPHHCIIATQLHDKEHYEFNKLPSNVRGKFSCWVYDFEANTVLEHSEREVIYSYDLNPDGYYPTIAVPRTRYQTSNQYVNMACLVNIETGEEKTFVGESALADFLQFLLLYNNGNNICIAHNASGYDGQLIYRGLKTILPKQKVDIILNGSKVMQLKISSWGNNFQSLIFRDSFLHLPGALKNLIKEFCGTSALSKGDFPHLFNSVENYSYIGPIPDRSFFSLAGIKNDKELVAFDEWYGSWAGRTDWNFMEELSKYCMNDTRCLAKIVKDYHEICMETFSVSPWFKPTAAGFVHDMLLQQFIRETEIESLRDEDMTAFRAKVEQLALEDFWAVLIPFEYWTARAAFRGGRTDARKMYFQLTAEQIAAGWKIKMLDINSQYPYAQSSKEFPTGKPIIHVWDEDYLPCRDQSCVNSSKIKCNTHRTEWARQEDKVKKVVRHTTQPTQTFFDDPTFFGFITVSLTPPTNLFHPVLVRKDEDLNKCIASLDPIVEGTFTSVEFKVAIANGYRIDKVHSFHQYKKSPSLWTECMRPMYVRKMSNSESNLPDAEFDELLECYQQEFGQEFRDLIAESRGKWADRPSIKLAAKIVLNTIWGKHVEAPIQSKHIIYNRTSEISKIYNLYENFNSKKYQYGGSMAFGDERHLFKFTQTDNVGLDSLKKGYAPAAIFVPAYGRLQLLEQMLKLDKRVLYHDTDSIIYVSKPGEYDIPHSEVFGGWGEEKVSTRGIVEAVFLGCKTYALRCADGNQNKKLIL